MAWFKKDTAANEAIPEKKVKIPEGLWVKCNSCKETIYRKEVDNSLKVCPKCGYHFPISIEERIGHLIDEGTFKELYSSLAPEDPLEFKDSIRYKQRLKNYQKKTGYNDSIVIGTGAVGGYTVVLGILNFSFMGGSMGSVVGEKVVLAVDKAIENRSPLIIVSASGGARMQEGIISLMQMAKTSAAIARLGDAGLPYISILTDPTFGGVTASFAMLGDIVVAEPKALIGFAGPRVIEQTIKQQLPPGFQRAEFLLEHGLIDMIVERKKLKETLTKIVGYF
jgi:acetyl-CoA carboxylase carboxyl transferase subunit beta